MIEAVQIVAAVTAAYLLGSTPVGYLLGRAWGVDVLKKGSGRTGGTNVLRSAGITAALLTGALDVGKGTLAVWMAGWLVPGSSGPVAQVLAGAAVILGHNYSIFLRFRGGAGVGTSLGALSALYWPAALALIVLLLSVIVLTRYASIGSLVVAIAMPLLLVVLVMAGELASTYVTYGILASAIIIYAHRPNIQRLLAGNERRLGDKGRTLP
jgi:glycerol-3-phosphate acyltransferase PlsY